MFELWCGSKKMGSAIGQDKIILALVDLIKILTDTYVIDPEKLF